MSCGGVKGTCEYLALRVEIGEENTNSTAGVLWGKINAGGSRPSTERPDTIFPVCEKRKHLLSGSEGGVESGLPEQGIARTESMEHPKHGKVIMPRMTHHRGSTARLCGVHSCTGSGGIPRPDSGRGRLG